MQEERSRSGPADSDQEHMFLRSMARPKSSLSSDPVKERFCHYFSNSCTTSKNEGAIMKSIWIAQVEGNEIRVENGWLSGERLYVNGQLQDRQTNVFSASLSGSLKAPDGKELPVKANLGGFFRIRCHLFVDNRKVALTQVK